MLQLGVMFLEFLVVGHGQLSTPHSTVFLHVTPDYPMGPVKVCNRDAI